MQDLSHLFGKKKKTDYSDDSIISRGERSGSRSAFKRDNPTFYRLAKERNLLDVMFGKRHAPRGKPGGKEKYTKQDAIDAFKDCKTRTESHQKNPYLHNKALKERWHEAFAHMPAAAKGGRGRKPSELTDAEVIDFCQARTTRDEVRRDNSEILNAAYNRGLIEECFGHMRGGRHKYRREKFDKQGRLRPILERGRFNDDYWDEEKAAEVALASGSITDFANDHTDAFQFLIKQKGGIKAATDYLGMGDLPRCRDYSEMTEQRRICALFTHPQALLVSYPKIHRKLKAAGTEDLIAPHFVGWRKRSDSKIAPDEVVIAAALETASTYTDYRTFRVDHPELFERCRSRGVHYVVCAHMEHVTGPKIQRMHGFIERCKRYEDVQALFEDDQRLFDIGNMTGWIAKVWKDDAA